MRRPPLFRPSSGGGLGIVAIAYVGIDYLRHLSPSWHGLLQPVLLAALAIAAVTRVLGYKHWSLEMRAAVPFVLSIVFLLSALLLEMLSVRSVTAVLGLDWHNDTPPLPDVGQWFLLALNEKLPRVLVSILRARIIGLHHFLMLYIMLNFSVLFNSIEAPGLGLGARYIFTMGIAITGDQYLVEVQPEWGMMNFLADFLRPAASEASSRWLSLLKKGSGGCNDLIYSGHVLVAVLTAMAWTEAYGGFSSVLIWVFVMHSAQREIRERHHYTVDCVVAIYMGIFLWKMTTFFWPVKDRSREARLNQLEKVQIRLLQAAKDSDVDQVRKLLEEVDPSHHRVNQDPKRADTRLFSWAAIFFSLVVVLLALTLLSDG